MFHVGIDLHQKYSAICVVDEKGEVLERTQIASTEASFDRWFKGRSDLKIVLECGGSSRWVTRLLQDRGHDVLVVNPRRVRLIAESSLKTDQIDAEVLAQLSCVGRGLLRSVFHRSDESNLIRTRLGVRSTLVRSRVAMVNSVRGTLRGLGYRLSGGTLSRFIESYSKAKIPGAIREALDPLMESIVELQDRIDDLTGEFYAAAKSSDLLQRLQTVPGVGPIVSTAFVCWVDDPSRFSRSRHVGTYAGLRPILRSSGGTSRWGGITREGDPEMRRLLVQSAHVLLRSSSDCALKKWGLQLADRAGKKKAVVALARKLAVLLHRLWVTGESFEPFPSAA